MAIPVSGPGKYSQRTDKQPVRDLPNPDYGEEKVYKEQQRAAPMAQGQQTPPMDFASLFGDASSRVVPMGADSQTSSPVTDGAALGAGAGIESLGLSQNMGEDDLKTLIPSLPVLEYMANQTGASWAMRKLVRDVKALI